MTILENLRSNGFNNDVINSLLDSSDTTTEIESVNVENNPTLLEKEDIVIGLDSEINQLFTLTNQEISSAYRTMKIQKILLHLIFILEVIGYYSRELDKKEDLDKKGISNKSEIKTELRKYLGFLQKFLKLVAPIFLQKYKSDNEDKTETSKLLKLYISGVSGNSDTVRLNNLISRIRNAATSKLNSWGIYKTIGRTTQKIRSKLGSIRERIGETSSLAGRYIGVRGGKRKNKSSKKSKNISRKNKKSRKG
jgi:hypothetical protein